MNGALCTIVEVLSREVAELSSGCFRAVVNGAAWLCEVGDEVLAVPVRGPVTTAVFPVTAR